MRSLLKIIFCPYLRSILRGKGSYLEITLKKLFLAHSCENIKIQGKLTFLPIYLKRKLFSDDFEKVVFCPYIGKCQHIQKKGRCFEITIKNGCLPYLRTINISRKTTFIWDLFKKSRFCNFIIASYKFATLHRNYWVIQFAQLLFDIHCSDRIIDLNSLLVLQEYIVCFSNRYWFI